MNESNGPAPEQTLIGADAKLAIAAEIRKNVAERRAEKDNAKAEKAAARTQWWADKRAKVSNMSEAIVAGVKNAKDTVINTGKATVEGIKTAHDTDVKNKERLQDWIATLPAKAYDTLAAADNWVDTKTDAWANKLDATVDSTAGKLGSKAEEYATKVKAAIKERQDAQREAKKAIGNLSADELSSGDILKSGSLLAMAEQKVAGLKRMQETFASAQGKAESRGRLTRGTANTLRRVRGVATFN